MKSILNISSQPGHGGGELSTSVFLRLIAGKIRALEFEGDHQTWIDAKGQIACELYSVIEALEDLDSEPETTYDFSDEAEEACVLSILAGIDRLRTLFKIPDHKITAAEVHEANVILNRLEFHQ